MTRDMAAGAAFAASEDADSEGEEGRSTSGPRQK